MSLRAYVDTNVFIDFFEDRDSAAYQFFMKTIGCAYTIVISTAVIHETNRRGGIEMGNTIKILEDVRKIEIMRETQEDTKRAKNILARGNTHFADAVHIALAERARVDLIVTKNTKDFVNTTKILVKNPNST